MGSCISIYIDWELHAILLKGVGDLVMEGQAPMMAKASYMNVN